MPTYLLIGIPIIVALLLLGIMSLPDEPLAGMEEEEKSEAKAEEKSKKKILKKKK